jgi:dipeptidyl aminopeptidase/acylaminoacyl peptidase
MTLAAMQGSFRLDLSAHQIRCLSFAPDSRLFATGHPDALVRLWDSETGGLETSLSGSQATITSIHVSLDGRHVAAGAKDGSVLVWDIASGDVAAQLPLHGAAVSCVRWSPRGDRLAITLGDFLDQEGSILLIWSPTENIVVREQPLENPAGALAWLGDDALLMADWSGQALLWSTRSGKSLGAWQVEKDQVSAAAWSADCPLVNRYLTDQFLTGSQR